MTIPSLDALRDEVAGRLSGSRLAHVEAVAETAAGIAAAGRWCGAVAEGVLRAAWIHDALKEESLEAWIRTIETAGWEPDPWALAHRPHLLHAEAAAAWALTRGDEDPAVVDAVRHHPTGDPAWESVGRILFVADFCEPTRRYADELDTAALRSYAGEGEEGLAEAARHVLALRLQWLIRSARPIHPRSWSAWNAWSVERSRRLAPRSPAP